MNSTVQRSARAPAPSPQFWRPSQWGLGLPRLPRQSGVQHLIGQGAFAALLLATCLSAFAWWRVSYEFFITVSDLLYVLAGLGLLLSGAATVQRHNALLLTWLGCFALMVGGLLVGSLLSDDPTAWFNVAIQYFFSYVILPALLIILVERHASAVIAGWSLAGIVLLELAGVLLYFAVDGSHSALSWLAPDFISGARRLGSFTNEANWNGAVIAMAFPLLLYFRGKRKLGLGITVAISLLLIAGLVLSASVTGLAAAVASVGTYCVIARAWPNPRAVLLLIFAVGAIYTTGYGPSAPQAFEKRVAPALESGEIEEAGTFVGRWDLIKEAWEIVEDTDLIGIGVNQYRRVSAHGAPVHNMYLLLWAEGGLLSLLGWMGMIGLLVAKCALATRDDRSGGAVGFAVLAAFLLFTTASPHMYARLWVVPLVVAMSVVINAPLPSVPTKPDPRQLEARLARARRKYAR